MAWACASRWWLAHRGESRLSTGYKLIFISSLSAYAVSTNRGEYCVSKAAAGMIAKDALLAIFLAERLHDADYRTSADHGRR